MKNITRLACLCVIFITCCGCISHSTYRYVPVEKLETGVKPLPLTVAVAPLVDTRVEENEDNVYLAWVPLVPYASSHYVRPETNEKFSFRGLKPDKDFATAILAELRQNNLFSDVSPVTPNMQPTTDLVLTGRIVEARVDTTTTLYGGSVLGVIPWLAGLPQGSVSNRLDIRYELKRASDGSVAWKHEVKGDWSRIFGLYYNYSKDEPYTGVNRILRNGLHEALSELAAEIRQKPLEYWKPGPSR